MTTTNEKLLATLKEYQVHNNRHNTKDCDELTVFLHTSVATSSDCKDIIKQITQYHKSNYKFAVAPDVLTEIEYLANNKKSLFQKNARQIYKAYRKGYIQKLDYNNIQTTETAVLCPSLPFAYRLRYKSKTHFKYIVTLADIEKIAVIVDGDPQVSKWLFSSKGSIEGSSATPVNKYVVYNKRKVNISKSKHIDGGEASLYYYGDKLIKVYHNGNMTNTKVQKIQRLMDCAKNKRFRKIVSVPTSIVTDTNRVPCGIVLPRLKRYTPLNKMLKKGLSAKKCRYILKLYLLRIFELNLMSIVVSDINPSNVLYKHNEIVIVDADSFQIGCYPSGCYRQDLLDKSLYDNLENIDKYIRDIKADILSFASIVFTLLIGVKPTRYKDSNEFSNFVTHPFLYRNRSDFYDTNIIDEALKNWNENLNFTQREVFVSIFKNNQYISHVNLDKNLFG